MCQVFLFSSIVHLGFVNHHDQVGYATAMDIYIIICFFAVFAALVKGIVHQFFFYGSNLIFSIIMECGRADFGQRDL